MTSPGKLGELVAGRYRLGDPVGRGGMGAVYRARDELLGRDVAIKLLLPTREGPEAQARFRREARAAAMLSDPHVVASYDFGPHREGCYLAMELVEGHTVDVELKLRGPLKPDWAVEIVRQAAAGLAAAHQHGLVHRDIKPVNLLITGDGVVKVADFGIVRILDDTTTTLTATGQVVGTSPYLAPERVLGEPAGPASDVYALGCVLYQLVTGHPPFTAEDPASVMYQHVQVMPVPPSDLRPQLAGEFESLLFWLLAKDPADRPTAAQVAAGAEPPSLARTGTLPEPAGHAVGTTRRRPSRTVLVGVAAVLAVAAASTVGVLITTNAKSPGTGEVQPSVPAAGSRSPGKSTSGVPVTRTSTRPPTVASKATAGASRPAGTSVDATEAATTPSIAPTKSAQPTKTKRPKPTKPTKTPKPHTTGKPAG